MLLLGAFQILLYRYTGETDLIVGSPVASRNRVELKELVGLFTNTLALRTNLGEEPSFRQLVQRVRRVVLGAYAHQDLPFELLVEALKPERHLDGSPLFQVVFTLLNVPRSGWSLPGLSVEAEPVDSGAAKFDLALSVQETSEGLWAHLEYDADLFEPLTISRMLEHFRALLEGVIQQPDRSIAQLPMLSPAEKRELIVDWNHTRADYPRDLPIHRVFESQVRIAPDSVALVCEEETLTYGELNRRANRLARYLQAMGLGPEALVGVCLDRSPALIVVLLAILKAGGAYVPLERSWPNQRIAEWVDKLALLVTDTGLRPRHRGQSRAGGACPSLAGAAVRPDPTNPGPGRTNADLRQV
jgi:non-ribosomal peptide synthetase component F